MIKGIVRKVINFIGFDIRKFNINNVDSLLILRCMEVLNIDLIIDVGANTGQYGTMIRKAGYSKSIVSFEPLKAAFTQLEKSTKGFGDWKVYNLGIGNTVGEVVINVAENSVSSSLLDVMEASVKVEPSSKFSRTETIQLITLNKYHKDSGSLNKNIYLKIDVQGYELEVLKGATDIIPNVKAMQLELSTTPLYAGAPEYDEVIMKMKEIGFELYSVLPEFRNPVTGRLLQFDGIFVRKEILDSL
jgi:FkbM family methyltransferase